MLLLFAATLTAQPVFQKKLEGIQAAEGLTILPDGGSVIAGLKGNCIQIVRLNPTGGLVWTRQVCPVNTNADITIGTIHLAADAAIPGAFLLLFRKGAFTSSPANLLNLMKFDANGGLLWETQLRPEKRYGPYSPGRQLDVTPSGAIWAAHAMGFTNALPDFNQALVYKVSASGQTLLRQFFLTDVPATANGIAAKNDQEIYVYGALGTATTDGFLIKINETGHIIWSNRYRNMHFLRDGGFFPNGDLLLMAEHKNAYALTRVRPDGSVAWASKFADTLSLFHCTIAADGHVLAAARKPDMSYFLFNFTNGTGISNWAKTYEDCTRYPITALQSMPDGGFVFNQSSIFGSARMRIVKSDNLGQLSPECPSSALPAPVLESLSVPVSTVSFVLSGALTDVIEHVFDLSQTNVEISDCCPTEYPDARFDLPDAVCMDAPFSLVATGNSCAEAWQWQILGAIPETSQEAVFQNLILRTTGDFAITLTETIGVCSDTFQDTLKVVQRLGADIFAFTDTVVCPDAPFRIQATAADFNNLLWDDGSTTPERLFDPPVEGTYRLTGQEGLCAVTDSFSIKIGKCGPTRIFAANVFLPNSDGKNDFWEIFGQYGILPLHCQIFDRWGNLCYNSTAEMPRWDGNLNGRPMPAGVYVWQFRLRNAEGIEEILSGNVLLLR